MATQPLQQSHHRSKLPSWNRPSLGARAAGPKSLPKDSQAQSSHQGWGPVVEGGQQQRVLQLEKNLTFLTEQHVDTLKQLHREAERLKQENKELNFRLTMCRCGHTRHPPAEAGSEGTRGGRGILQSIPSKDESEPGTPSDEIRVVLLEEKVRELRKCLALERSKNAWLLRVIEQKLLEQKNADHSDCESGVSPGLPQLVESKPRGHRPLPHTRREYETMIKHLQDKTTQQSHELMQLKADLCDVLYSHKWTPDAYLMARAYVSGLEEEEEGQETGLLPTVATQGKKEMVDRAYQRVQDGVVLPALVPRLPTNLVAERQRRSQALRGGGLRIVGRERSSL